MNLSTKYRPKTFREVMDQQSIIKVLEKQIESRSFKNCYLFSGPSGCGKTTLARIMANEINNGIGSPIEIDGASNNGVDNVRSIIDGSVERSLDSEYKIYIIDECHMITTAGWNAFLKCIEETPQYTIFIFCTTDPKKVPDTIKNRCQIFSISRVSLTSLVERLLFICNQEGYQYSAEALEYISKLSNGSLRQAISYLDKCKDYSTTINLQNVIDCLGDYSYDVLFDLTNARIDGDKKKIVSIIENLYDKGSDLKLFIDNYLDFILDINKYCIFDSIEATKMPKSLEEKIKYTINIEDRNKFFSNYLDTILEIKQVINGDPSIKNTIEIMLLN